ncbi:glycosyltransferase [Thioalkalivibrio sp.]|uniref:glycosyltransferase n=1 Tax=Thioalkalivibrio sp. TaxID=2093813 RepID=UPI003564C101
MRILMLSDVYFPRINGVSTSIQTFARDLADIGHEIDLLAPEYPHRPPGREAAIERIPSRYLFFDPEDRMMSGRTIRRMLPTLRSRNYDLVHIQTPFVAHYSGIRIARGLGIPLVETYHTHFEEYLYHYLPWLPARWLRAAARRFTRSQCNQVDAVVVPSSPVRDTLLAYGVQKPLRVIPTGLDMHRFRGGDGARFRHAQGIAADRPVLVHVGRVAHEKNVDFLLRVLQRVRVAVPEVLLMIVGEGPARRHLEGLSRQLGLESNVLFLGYLNRERELLDCYSAGDVFVFASRTETQGLVLLEAMALGVPVVALAEMGTRDILAPGRGALVAREDPEDFSAKVLQLLQDPGFRRTMADDARDYVKSWSAPLLAERMLDLYRSLL